MRTFLLHKFAIAGLFMSAGALAQAAELTVSAAASLTDAFKEIARDYEARYPGTTVLLNFGASGALLQQMAKGAPVDVFASADQETMDAAVAQGLVAAAERRNFVRNALVVIVPRDATAPLTRLDDLRQAGIERIAIGNPASVPAGRYARQALVSAALWEPLASKFIQTQNVRQALDYVARGETGAGFVYASDAMLFKERVKVAFEVPLALPITYPIARTTASRNGAEASRFSAYVQTPAAQAVLVRYGFLQP
ncbi:MULTISPECIES: molybdate ABC transporter substrate-binding protein [unclassified Massilia]|uniref:molybdate ABC transporter substrate-binding protein n=1 Tax=unclassified Massilia TaxID=2609279 RepID=UPI00177F54AA|nr:MULTISPECIES: molybdate ABC transporter substrate-binding protein [unclassified Massilia]MBD8532755.1 molybdate ABC transporter substrate-binding protein [Massilia sp. CFBP 13647]MBD8676128.1 molybdate ABC transporter substrate-binding protein [Massilia sp. CFBP 13721]